MTPACHLIKKYMSQITVGKYPVYTKTAKSMAWFWTDFVLQATIKFNSAEPKVKYNRIKVAP